jgi:hypothetical protein
MTPDERDGHPFPNKISAPRLVCQQFDAINYTSMLTPWRTEFFKKLDNVIKAKIDPKMLYTVYLVIFVLLHEISTTSKDRYWHARHRKNVQLRYDMESFMEKLHEGAYELLYTWHYYKCGFNPLNANAPDANPLDADWEKIPSPDDTKTTEIFNNMTLERARLMIYHAQLCRNNTGEQIPTRNTAHFLLTFRKCQKRCRKNTAGMGLLLIPLKKARCSGNAICISFPRCFMKTGRASVCGAVPLITGKP